MFDKNITVPTALLQAEALLGRLAVSHPKRSDVESYMKILRSGYNGEKTINYYLRLLPEKQFFIFHDLRLPIRDSFFQIDALLLNPKGILIIEGKNHSGKLIFERKQMLQEINGTKEIYENPLAQVARHKTLLKYFLKKHHISDVAIDDLVVVCKSSTEIVISSDYSEAEEKIFRAYELVNVIEMMESVRTRTFFEDKTVNKIRKLLLSKHTPKQTDILKMFEIPLDNLLTGVHCLNCFTIPLIYKKGKWFCPSCKIVSKDGIPKAIDDYFLLIKPSFTNKELCNFLQLPTARATSYLLTSLPLSHKGKKRHRVYSKN
ncbi:MAG: NERD domain-containing protein [Bacillota bacterium]